MAKISKILNALTFDAVALPENANQPKITKKSVDQERSLSPRRICFATTHKNALRVEEKADYKGKFSVPFRESVYPIFNKMVDLELFKSKQYGNWWRSLKSEHEVDDIEEWIDKMGQLVFLRDTLALSIALEENLDQDGDRTEIGELEYRAKYHQEEESIEALRDEIIRVRDLLPYYTEADAICAVPPRPDKDFDLPSLLAERVSEATGLKNITSKLSWKGSKPSLKEESFADKWDILEGVGLNVSGDLGAPKIMLIDDLYQSGTTMQFVASRLQDAGAKRIFGIAVVKSRKDSDNL